MSTTSRYDRAQAEAALDHYRALLNHAPDDYHQLQRELRKVTQELKALGYYVTKTADGEFCLKNLPREKDESVD